MVVLAVIAAGNGIGSHGLWQAMLSIAFLALALTGVSVGGVAVETEVVEAFRSGVPLEEEGVPEDPEVVTVALVSAARVAIQRWPSRP